jgi:hypothetical protein
VNPDRPPLIDIPRRSLLMSLYKSSNTPGRHLLHRFGSALRWLVAALLCAVAVLLVGHLIGLWPAGSDLAADALWVWVAQVVAMWLAVMVLPGRRARAAAPAPLPPAAADCVAPTAAYVVGAETVMTPAELERLWLLRPANDPVVRPAVPPVGDDLDGRGRRD